MTRLAMAVVAAFACGGPGSAWAQDIDLHYLCYNDANECAVSRALLDRFEADNPSIKVTIDEVDYLHILNQLPADLATGSGPDMARVTDFGSLNPYFLDITPYVDAGYWEQNFQPALDWLRGGPQDEGIYGWLTQLTVTGPYINRTMFDDAGVALPPEGASWQDWADATRRVQDTLGIYAAMVMDRSGHRFAGPAISMGAAYFDAGGRPAIIDDGFKTMTRYMIDWHAEGLMPEDVWPATPGAVWKNGAEMFIDGNAVLHMSGSWMIQSYAANIGERFDWMAIPQPCGPAGCSGMPGGAAMVGLSGTEHPREVAAVLDFMASEPVIRDYYEQTLQIPAHRGLAAAGLNYGDDIGMAAAKALKTFTGNYEKILPQAHALQAYPHSFAIFDATLAHVADAIAGRVAPEEAYASIERDVAAAVQ